MDSRTPPKAPSPKHVSDLEASSQRDLGQGGGAKTVKAAPGGQTSVAGHTREKAPMDTDGGGYLEFGPQLDPVPENNTTPESGRQPPSIEGGAPVPVATSAQPEVPDTLSAALKSASIVEEHRALMGAVIEKIQSAKSRLNEACISLITGFEVCFEVKECHSIDSSP